MVLGSLHNSSMTYLNQGDLHNEIGSCWAFPASFNRNAKSKCKGRGGDQNVLALNLKPVVPL